MFLTQDEKTLLTKTTKRNRDGEIFAKQGISRKDKEKLLIIDELSFMTNGEHLICNFEDLE